MHHDNDDNGDQTVNDSCPVCNLWASATAAKVVPTLLLQLLILQIPSKETKAKLNQTYTLDPLPFSSQPITPHPL